MIVNQKKYLLNQKKVKIMIISLQMKKRKKIYSEKRKKIKIMI
jgi:hypothetical protein